MFLDLLGYWGGEYLLDFCCNVIVTEYQPAMKHWHYIDTSTPVIILENNVIKCNHIC